MTPAEKIIVKSRIMVAIERTIDNMLFQIDANERAQLLNGQMYADLKVGQFNAGLTMWLPPNIGSNGPTGFQVYGSPVVELNG